MDHQTDIRENTKIIIKTGGTDEKNTKSKVIPKDLIFTAEIKASWAVKIPNPTRCLKQQHSPDIYRQTAQ